MNNNFTPICPIYFENHNFAGHVSSIEEFTNCNFGVVRTTFLNGKPYFAAKDVCIGLCLDSEKTYMFVQEAAKDIINSYYSTESADFLTPLTRRTGVSILPHELYYNIDVEVSHAIGNSDKIVTQKVKTTFVSEPVLYMLIFRSRKREAVAFKAWLSMEILPNLRPLGRETSAQFLHNESEKILSALNEIKSNYKEIDANDSWKKSAMFEILMGQKSIIPALANIQESIGALMLKADNIGYMGDGILYNQNNLDNKIDGILYNQNNLDDKITNIASGLNMVFSPLLNK